MEGTLPGMVMDSMPHRVMAYCHRLISLGGNLISFKLVHPSNTKPPILVTVSGILTETISECPLNKSSKRIETFIVLDKFTDAAGLPNFLFDHFQYIKTNASLEVPVSNHYDQYPLLIFSHGLGTTPFIYTSLLEELASNGFIIVAIDHTYSTMATTFPDDKVTGFDADDETFSYEELKQLEETWVKDVKFVLNEMEHRNTNDGMFAQKIDLTKIGTFGHSFGGATAYQSCYEDDRIKAAVNIDGSIYNISTRLSKEEKSLMLLASDEYANAIFEDSQAVEDLESYRFFRDVITKEGLFISIDGTKHYNFSDLPLMSPLVKMMGMVGDIEGVRGLEITNSYLLAFFQDRLGIQDGSLQHLKEKFPEVIYHTLQ